MHQPNPKQFHHKKPTVKSQRWRRECCCAGVENEDGLQIGAPSSSSSYLHLVGVCDSEAKE